MLNKSQAAQYLYSGFTLVELMVVVSIIAILAVIGLTVYSNVQKSARDSRRISDIGAIANALEVNYKDQTGYSTLAASNFADGSIPSDIYDGQNKCGLSGTDLCRYCVRTSIGACTSADPMISNSNPASDVTSFILCTNLETGPVGYFCRGSQRQ